jgi:hypothetical protein
MLKEYLTDNAESILSRWFDYFLADYHPESSGFMKREKDRFHNPVGQTFASGTRQVYFALLNGADIDSLAESLQAILKIRAIQDISASRAVAPILALKEAIRLELKNAKSLTGPTDSTDFADHLAELESKIDRTALLAFDIYTECREKIHQIRIKEIRNRSISVMQAAAEKSTTQD